MKKGTIIGPNRHIGKSGEKYISWDKTLQKFSVWITTHGTDKRKQINIGRFKTKEAAIGARDNYLNKHG